MVEDLQPHLPGLSDKEIPIKSTSKKGIFCLTRVQEDYGKRIEHYRPGDILRVSPGNRLSSERFYAEVIKLKTSKGSLPVAKYDTLIR